MEFKWYECLKRIITTLKEGGYSLYADQIHQRELSGSMFSEILLGVCSKLLEIKIQDTKAYDLVRKDAESLIEFAISEGLHPKPTNLSQN